MAVKVQTTGSFMLLDPVSREVIEAEGVTTVWRLTDFMNERIELGQLEVVNDKKAEAEPAVVAETQFAADAKTRSERVPAAPKKAKK